MDWPADKVERWAVNRLIPFAKNARTHSDEQVAQIAASIREWGFATQFWSAGNQRQRLVSSRALAAVTRLYRSDTSDIATSSRRREERSRAVGVSGTRA